MKRASQGGDSPHTKRQLLDTSDDSDFSLPPYLDNLSQRPSHSSDSFVEAPLLYSSPSDTKFPSQYADLYCESTQQANLSDEYHPLPDFMSYEDFDHNHSSTSKKSPSDGVPNLSLTDSELSHLSDLMNLPCEDSDSNNKTLKLLKTSIMFY